MPMTIPIWVTSIGALQLDHFNDTNTEHPKWYSNYVGANYNMDIELSCSDR
jgi:hypothetical protein